MKKLTTTLALNYKGQLVGFEDGFTSFLCIQDKSLAHVAFSDKFQFGFDTTNVDPDQLRDVRDFLERPHYYRVELAIQHAPPIAQGDDCLRIMSVHLKHYTDAHDDKTLEDVVGHLLPETDLQKALRKFNEALWESFPIKLARRFVEWLTKMITWVKMKLDRS